METVSREFALPNEEVIRHKISLFKELRSKHGVPDRRGSWGDNARLVIEKRLTLKDGDGKAVETPEEMCWRVALATSVAETDFGGSEEQILKVANRIYGMMISRDAYPNSPTLTNAGKDDKLSLAACFVLPIGDSMESIFEAVKNAALIHKAGGGCVDGRSLVFSTFCGVEEIAVVWERISALPGRVPVPNGNGLAIDISDLEIQTLSQNPETGEFEADQVTHVWSFDVPREQQRTVTTSHGTVTTSSWHPFMVLRGGRLVEVRADELQAGEILMRPNRSVRHSWPVKQPKEVAGRRLNENLAWLLGFFQGGGSLGQARESDINCQSERGSKLCLRFSNGRTAGLERAASVLGQEFGDTVSVQPNARGRFALSTTKAEVTEWVSEAFAIKPGEKTVLRIPDYIFKSPLSVIRHYLAGLVDSHGAVDSRGQVSLAMDQPALMHALYALADLLGFEPAMREHAPHGRGKASVIEVKLSSSGKTPELRDFLLSAMADPVKRACLAEVSSDKPFSSDEPLPFASAAEHATVVRSVEIPAEKVALYDFSVARNSTYLASGGEFVVIHNTGFSFSKLRPAGARVRSTGGQSSGPLSFLRVFGAATESVTQGGTRRGANMGCLSVRHPQILDFIACKSGANRTGSLSNFNLSVTIDDGFMKALEKNEDYDLIDPQSGKPCGQLNSREVWDKIVHGAWETGDPGVIFIDTINRDNKTPQFGPMEATNPCFHPDTRIATERGLERIEDLCRRAAGEPVMVATDDRVWNRVRAVNGPSCAAPGVTMRPARVLRTGVKETVKVILSNGQEIKVTRDHRLLTSGGWREAGRLQSGDTVLVQSGAGAFADEDDIGAEKARLLANKSSRQVPKAIFTASRETVTAFIEALAGGDISRFAADSKQFLQEVQLLLLNLGVSSAIRQSSGSFELAVSRFGSEAHEAQVISVEPGETVDVYDIQEGQTRSLIANGIVAHNCGEQPLLPYEACFAPETRIVTDRGLETVEALYARQLQGDRVTVATNLNGQGCHIVFRPAVVVKTGTKPVVRLTLTNGQSIRLTPDHQVFTEDGWRQAGSLTQGDRVMIQTAMAGTLTFETSEREVHKYQMLGWLTGDRAAFDQPPPDWFEFTSDANRTGVPRNPARCASPRRAAALENFEEIDFACGLGCKKRLPPLVFGASKQLQIAYLQGLFGADGCKIPNQPEVGLASASVELLRDVQVLLLNLGIRSNIECSGVSGWGRAHSRIKVSGESYLRFMDLIGFPLTPGKHPKSLDFIRDRTHSDRLFVGVASVEEAGISDVYDVSEPVTHSLIAEGIVVHNCNLGSINLARFVKLMPDGRRALDTERLAQVAKLMVRFLDNIIQVSHYPLPEIMRMVHGNRKIGLGVMGYADLLIDLGLPYDSDEALAVAEKAMSAIHLAAKDASAELALERGEFPNFSGSVYGLKGERKYRNAAVTTIAPTGTIGIIAEASGGIEPLFAVAYTRTMAEGHKLPVVHPKFVEIAKREGFYSEELMDAVAEHGSVRGLAEVPTYWQRVFVTAHEVEPEWHVKTQAAFQAWLDNACSKTVNFAKDASPADIEKVYWLAYKTGCKGVTVFRDGCLETQVLTIGTADGSGTAGSECGVMLNQPPGTPIPGSVIQRLEGPEERSGRTKSIDTPLGKLNLIVNELAPGVPFEIFAVIGKAGSDITADAEAIGRLVSLALQCGIHVSLIAKMLKGIGGSQSVGFGPKRVTSIADAIGKYLEESYLLNGDSRAEPIGTVSICPSCGVAAYVREVGCSTCRNCGFSQC